MKKFIFVLILMTLISCTLYAQEVKRPMITQFGESNTVTFQEINKNLSPLDWNTPINLINNVNKAAYYLQHAQADITEDNAGNGNPDVDPEDGGWDWVLTSPAFTHTSAASPTNTYGTGALGLYYAYLKTYNPTYLTALQDAIAGIMSNANCRTASDIELLLLYQDMPGVTPNIYKDTAKARYDRRIVVYGSATALAQYIRDVRYSQGYSNGIIPWDIGKYVVAAKMLYDKFGGNYLQHSQDMAEVLYQDSYNNNPGYFKPDDPQNKGWDSTYTNHNFWWYTCGLSGLMDAFFLANVHTDKIPGLITLIGECKYTSGVDQGAYSGSYGANGGFGWTDADWQTTAYVIMSLAKYNKILYQADINSASYYLDLYQDPVSGAWIYSDGTHYPTVGGEILSGASFGQNPPDLNIACAVGAPISLPNTDATIQFANIGSNNVNPTITVQRIDELPGTPASAGTPMPVYFIVTATGLQNYTFEATIVLDVSGVTGFNSNTVFMTSQNGTSGWVAANGTYNPTAQTYTFTTNHFSYFAFVNPVLSNMINLYVSTSTSSPYGGDVYPNITWNTPLTNPPDAFNWTPSAANHDWTYKSRTGSYYILPVGQRSFYAATMKIVWNPAVVSGVTITQGNLFDGNAFFTTNMGTNWVIIDASCLDSNKTPDGSKYLAKLDFAYNTGSGSSVVAIENVTIVYQEGSNAYEVLTVTQGMGGKLKFYLGDFASTTPASEDTGDGLINGTDLPGFATAYWSNYNDAPTTLYKSKYDIGPTTPTRYYFGNPVPDGTIGFEDLTMFAIGYSKTGSGTLPDNPAPVIFSLDKIAKENGTLRLPIRISGNVNDVRALSMRIKYGNDMEYTGVEMAGEMLEGVKFLIGKSESGTVYMDGAALDEYQTGLSREGVIAYILFNEKTTGNHNASIESVIARNSGNLDLEVQYEGDNNGLGIPKTFELSQNYPNPFNPVTKINYAIPNDVKVTIKIYDVLGREVNVLVNEVQTAGYYTVNWNASSLSSGIYFYQMKAGNFIAVKKMMLIK